MLEYLRRVLLHNAPLAAPQDVTGILDWIAAALNHVDRAEFFQSFDEGHAVQYFYEPFLHAFDPDLRKELGVWYTPPETPVPGVTGGKIRDDLKGIAVFQRVDGKPANPEEGDLDLTAGWGHAGKGGITMPGRGKLIRRDDGACDIFLNDIACWRNVPETMWDYTLGGYQVIKKWPSYREKPLLGRGLTHEEVRYVTEIDTTPHILRSIFP